MAANVFGQAPYQISVVPAFGPIYPADRWVPIRIELRNSSENAIDGSVRIPVTMPKGATEFRYPVNSPPNSRVIVNAYAYLPDKPLAQATADGGTGTAPVAIAEWLRSDGARLARADLLGQPDTVQGDATTGIASVPGYLLLSVSDRDMVESRDAYRVRRLAEYLRTQSSITFSDGESDPVSLPRHLSGYDSVRAVIFNGVSPEALDLAQRDVLMQYLLTGGVVLLPAPLDRADPTGSWIDPLLPVAIVGRREGNSIGGALSEAAPTTQAPNMLLSSTLELCEAVDAGGDVLLGDSNYVHASVKRIGLGRIVFTSFPIAAIDQDDPRTRLLWHDLLALDEPTREWSASALFSERDGILESMIGAPVAPWSHAAWIAGGYVAVMIAIQLAFPGARRPLAFMIGAGAAVIAFGALLAVTSTRMKDDGSFSAARLAVIDLSATGGGVKREALAFFGRDDESFSLSSRGAASLRAVASVETKPATISQPPFEAPAAGVRSGRIDHVWESSIAVNDDQALEAKAKFTSRGVQIEIDNLLGENVVAPVVLWNRQCYRLPSLPARTSKITLGENNAPGDYTNASVLAGEASAIRGRIVASMAAPALHGYTAPIDSRQPIIVGWLDAAKADFSQPLALFSSQPTTVRAQVAVRVPMQIVPSDVGQALRIEPEFVRIVSASGANALYDDVKREWLQSLQTGDWLIGFQAPREIGKLKPLRATLSADLAAPGHRITFRRGQGAKGYGASDNAEGPVVATWDGVVGSRSVSFELDSLDADGNGCVWLRLSVEEAASGGTVLAQWKFNNLSVALDAAVEPQGTRN